MLVPEVASRFKVSNGGMRYTFFLSKGFRFSDGAPVTAASFKYAFDRIANPQLASQGARFVDNVTAVRARRNRLVIDLKSVDPRFLAKLTMPFFQATSRKLPIDREVVDVRSMTDLPSAGPYA